MELLDKIEESKKLLKLKDNWDSNGAIPVNFKAYSNAIELLIKLNNNKQIRTPEIIACTDGSIDLSFREKGKPRMLINVHDNGIGWYGDDGYNNNKIKNIIIGSLYDKDLYKWINENLTIS